MRRGYDVRGLELAGGRYHDIGDYDAYQATFAGLHEGAARMSGADVA